MSFGRTFLLLTATALVTSTFVAATIKFVDLSYAYDNTTLTWPSDKESKFRFIKRTKAKTASYEYEANSFSVAEHSGTHLDAPRHFAAGKHSSAEVPLQKLIGTAVVVNVVDKAKNNSDLLIDVIDFENHEKKFGRIPDDSIILLYSGWGKYWPNATAYYGTASNDTSILHFPGLAPTAATWLIQQRKVKAIGIDTGSIDYGQSKTFRSHVILMEKNIPIFENVANLKNVPQVGAMVYALPMKIDEGSGAPLRIIATWNTNKKPSASSMIKASHFAIFFSLMACLFIV
eukprot:gene7881-8732_t